VKFVEFTFKEENDILKSTGVVRKVDDLGRVVIPIELRRTLGMAVKDAMEIYVDQDKIMLKKYEPACIFCGNADDVHDYRGKNICMECFQEIAKVAI
jgi:transcriptional pleiotropic regulator of transition state genes